MEKVSTHVVHLEDDGPLREILKISFHAAEPTIDLHQFIVSDDAIAYVEQNRSNIDLIILDIRVPGTVDGLGVAAKIREFGCSAKVILTSAYRQPDTALLNSLQAEWYAKPWHIMEITQRLLKVVRERQSSPRIQTTLPPTISPPKADVDTGKTKILNPDALPATQGKS